MRHIVGAVASNNLSTSETAKQQEKRKVNYKSRHNGTETGL